MGPHIITQLEVKCKFEENRFLVFFSASVRLQQPGPTIVSGLCFVLSYVLLYAHVELQICKYVSDIYIFPAEYKIVVYYNITILQDPKLDLKSLFF